MNEEEDEMKILFQKIQEKRNRESLISRNREIMRKNFLEFGQKFNEVEISITKVVSQLNDQLKNTYPSLKLHVVTGVENELSNLKAIQVVLSEPADDVNLLDDPYLLIEGYVSDGKIRFAKGGSMDAGKTFSVDEINSEVIQTEIADFLKTV